MQVASYKPARFSATLQCQRTRLDKRYLDIKIISVARPEASKPGPKSRAGRADTSGTHVWLVLMKAYRALERQATSSIESAQMGLSDFATLELLLHKGPQRVNEIGRRIQLTSGSITTAVGRMEARGLVKRGSDPQDGRASVVELTPKGRALISEVFRAHKAAMDLTAEALSPAERASLIRLLKKIGLSAEQRAAASS
jgi:MarR family 2-MHQ and catechol resistance regulon transcriptional repressor